MCPSLQVTEPQPFELQSAGRHEQYTHAWALKIQETETVDGKGREFK
jgi:hypothetical protein